MFCFFGVGIFINQDLEIKRLADELANNNSQKALRLLFIYFYPKLLLFIAHYIKSQEIAEEIVSDVFLTVWQQRSKLKNVQNFKAYIYVIAKNLSISYLRKTTKQVHLDISYMDCRTYTDPETDLISSELMNSLNTAIESLPDKCKLAFKLVRDHNLKYKEAASILEISEKTLEAHMTLAVKRIRQKLQLSK